MERLRRRGCPAEAVVVPRKAEFDLVHEADVRRLYDVHQPRVVIHLAALVGGIGANRARPGDFFFDNLVMGALLMEYGRQAGVEKFVAVGTICAYPKLTPVPFREEQLWDGYPEETNAPYGLAKKMMLVQSQAYREQYGFNSIFLLPVNLYGPRDNFELESSHVIPALIRKFVEAQERQRPEVVAWGDGSPTREFLYGDDLALEVEPGRRVAGRVGAQPLAQLDVVEQPADLGGQPLGVASRDQRAGRRVGAGLPERHDLLRDAADRGRDDRRAAGQRLD